MRLVTAEFSLFVTVSVRVAVGAKLGFAVRGALMVDRILVVVAVVAGDALVLVVVHVRAELARLVAVVVAVAMGAVVGDTVLGAMLVDRLLTSSAKLAWNARVLEGVVEEGVRHEGALLGAELGEGVAVSVAVAFRPDLGDAVRGASVVDGVLARVAELAGDANVLVLGNVGAELGLACSARATVMVAVALRAGGRDTRVRALLPHREVAAAKVAWHALVRHVTLAGAKFGGSIAMGVVVAVGTYLRHAVCGAPMIDGVCALLAELA
jgi:hypothetical protein